MKAFALIALFATPALAVEDPKVLADRYDPVGRACFDEAQNPQEVSACVHELANACMNGEPRGGTTLGMSICYQAEAIFWDERLKAEYQTSMQKMKEMDDFEKALWPELGLRVEKLRESQRAWITFRDANCSFYYYYDGAGSMRNISSSVCLSRMAAERTVELMARRQGYVGDPGK